MNTIISAGIVQTRTGCLENGVSVHGGIIADSNDTKHEIFRQTNGCQAGTQCTTVLGDIWLCCKRWKGYRHKSCTSVHDARYSLPHLLDFIAMNVTLKA